MTISTRGYSLLRLFKNLHKKLQKWMDLSSTSCDANQYESTLVTVAPQEVFWTDYKTSFGGRVKSVSLKCHSRI